MDRKLAKRIVYASFDRFPSSKGAATHIDAFVKALGQEFGNVDLVTLPSTEDEIATNAFLRTGPITSSWRSIGVQHFPIIAPGPTLFDRVLCFRSQFLNWLRQSHTSQPIEIFHFRSIFEGYEIAKQKENLGCKLVFEVNGLPSIELKYRYPNVDDDDELQSKLRYQEQVCLEAADRIVTVSHVNATYLQERRGVCPSKIHVIPNGVDPEVFFFRPYEPVSKATLDERRPIRLLYSGTLSAWQGANVAVEALGLILRDAPCKLTLVGQTLQRQKSALEHLAWKTGVADHISILSPVSKSELAQLHHASDAVLAPLIRNDRNLDQGCCPLKVLEAMACGSPLVASNIPVVQELVAPNEAILVSAGKAKSIKDAVLRLIEEPHLGQQISTNAHARVTTDFTWNRAQRRLLDVYAQLLEE